MKLRRGPDGLHLFDRVTGLNVLLDEVSFSPDKWTTAPRQVSVALTNTCDLKCPYCYAPKTPATLDPSFVRGLLLEIDALGSFGVGFGGGEPTLHPAFPDLCRFAAQETQLAVTFTTHAHHLTPGLLQQLAGHVHFMRLSMDGTHGTYEKLRGRTYRGFLDRARAARNLSPIGFNVVVNDDTIDDLDAVSDIAAELGASELLLLPEQPTSRRPVLCTDVHTRLRAWVHAYQGSVPLAVSEASANGLPVCRPLIHETGLAAYAHVDANGELSPSSYHPTRIPIHPSTFRNALEQLHATLE